MKLFVLFVIPSLLTLAFAQDDIPSDSPSLSASTLPTQTPPPTPTTAAQMVMETEVSATRTISLEEASAIAKSQAENPNAFLSDPETQRVLAELQGWIIGMLGQAQSSPPATDQQPGVEIIDDNTNGGQEQEQVPDYPIEEEGQEVEDVEEELDFDEDCEDEEISDLPSTPVTVPNCQRTFVPVTGMSCFSAEAELGLESGTLIRLNPEINSDCTNMIAGDTYCIEAS